MKECILRIFFCGGLLLVNLPSAFSRSDSTVVIDEIVALVGDEIILKSEIDERVQIYLYQSFDEENVDSLWGKMLESTIDEKMVLAKAIRDSVEVSDGPIVFETERRLDHLINRLGSELAVEEYFGESIASVKSDLYNQIKNQRLIFTMQNKIVGNITVSNEAVKKFYKENQNTLPDLPAQVEISRIVIFPSIDSTSKSLAYDKLTVIQGKLKEGESFEALATEYSDDEGSREEGGDLGFIKRGGFLKNFEEAAFKLRDNEVSSVVETEIGLHLIKLVERRGESIHVKHLVVKFDKTKLDTNFAMHRLQDIKQDVLQGRISFSLAARVYSEEEATSKLGGDIVDSQTMNKRLNLDDLGPEVVKVTKSLNVDEISEPFKVFIPEKDKQGYAILYLKMKTDPHKMNLEQDYSLVQNLVIRNRKAETMKLWLEKLRSEIYWEYVVDKKQYR